MSFLEELENNKKDEQENTGGNNNRQLWESCFKYFQHFTTIIKKEDKTFDSEFNLNFLNITKECKIIGPYEIKRTNSADELKLEIKMFTKLNQGIKINRKDKRSAELLHAKLSKDSLLSTVKSDKDDKFYIELSPTIPSFFRIVLKNDTDFFIEYVNISSSTRRSIRLVEKNINEAYMEGLAKYIVGQNPSLYTEKISNQEITKIRDSLELNKRLLAMKEAEVKAERVEQKKQEEIKKANSLQGKSKSYLTSKGNKIKTGFFSRFIKSKPK